MRFSYLIDPKVEKSHQFMNDKSETPLTSAKIFEKMPEAFKPEAADGEDSIFEFDISGEGGGRWQVVIQNRTCKVIPNGNMDPTVIFRMSTEDHVGIVDGSVNAQMAFMMGRIKVEGDLMAALRFYQFFAK
jgi:putative sterol carrier protein